MWWIHPSPCLLVLWVLKTTVNTADQRPGPQHIITHSSVTVFTVAVKAVLSAIQLFENGWFQKELVCFLSYALPSKRNSKTYEFLSAYFVLVFYMHYWNNSLQQSYRVVITIPNLYMSKAHIVCVSLGLFS